MGHGKPGKSQDFRLGKSWIMTLSVPDKLVSLF